MENSHRAALRAWWRRSPRRPRWTYAILVLIVVGVVFGFLFLAPVSHSATANYSFLITIPSHASTPSCQETVFYQPGTCNFG